ncbi:MBL fold metallo-hydrolase [Alkalihalobacillus deserti]|uniref:MBL fold metallo-hydrolase n=1 Tax=Alkalihalobacillus deserti TaxID=2879466 RepID=UPI001D13FCAB|nr:MBL fold metallo-hydrolase [Alkalihalobacillus deserti]
MSTSVIMLGTGSPRLNKERMATAHLLSMGGESILVDCAEGTTMQLVKADIPPQDIKYVFFTHLHADHMLGYANFLISSWVEGRRELTVVGPVGTKKMHDLLVEMLENDINYRMSLGRPDTGIRDVKVIEIEKEGRVNVELPIDVHCAEMVHNVPTFAYRFDKESDSVVFGGDTAPPTDPLAKLAEGAGMLIHDACLTLIEDDQTPNSSKIWENLQKEHCTPAQAAETAKKANVKQLVLTHFLPKMNPKNVLDEAAGVFNGEIIIPNDLDVIKLSSKTLTKS